MGCASCLYERICRRLAVSSVEPHTVINAANGESNGRVRIDALQMQIAHHSATFVVFTRIVGGRRQGNECLQATQTSELLCDVW